MFGLFGFLFCFVLFVCKGGGDLVGFFRGDFCVIGEFSTRGDFTIAREGPVLVTHAGSDVETKCSHKK